MTFPEFLKELKKLEVVERRVDTESLVEFVLETRCQLQLKNYLESFFGPAFKPAGAAPTKDAQEYAAPLGGVRSNQTLYRTQQDHILCCAMIWPWGDGMMMTVKIFKNPL